MQTFLLTDFPIDAYWVSAGKATEKQLRRFEYPRRMTAYKHAACTSAHLLPAGNKWLTTCCHYVNAMNVSLFQKRHRIHTGSGRSKPIFANRQKLGRHECGMPGGGHPLGEVEPSRLLLLSRYHDDNYGIPQASCRTPVTRPLCGPFRFPRPPPPVLPCC